MPLLRFCPVFSSVSHCGWPAFCLQLFLWFRSWSCLWTGWRNSGVLAELLVFCNTCPSWRAGEHSWGWWEVEEGVGGGRGLWRGQRKGGLENLNLYFVYISFLPCVQIKITPSSIIPLSGGARINGFNFYFWTLLCFGSPFIWIPWSSRIVWQCCISEQSEEQINNWEKIRFYSEEIGSCFSALRREKGCSHIFTLLDANRRIYFLHILSRWATPSNAEKEPQSWWAWEWWDSLELSQSTKKHAEPFNFCFPFARKKKKKWANQNVFKIQFGFFQWDHRSSLSGFSS